MKGKRLLLLNTLLKSTSSINIFRTTGDKKKKRKIIGSYFGMGVLFLMLLVYCVLAAVGYAYYGLLDSLPGMTAVIICGLSFIFTMLKAGGYLFGFREYEMLMALPFSEKEIVSAKFMYMYMKNLPWNLVISVAMLIGYGFILRPAWYVYILWIVLTAFLPIIPMLAASFIGFLVARIGTSFKHWKAVQTVLTFAFVGLAFSARFIIEKIFRDGAVEQTLESAAESTKQIGSVYLPVAWFESAVTSGNILGAGLLILVSAVLFEVVFIILARSYKKINSAMKTTASGHKVKIENQKKKSAAWAIAEKELRRFVGSTQYFVNVGFGYIFAVLIGVVSLFVGLDRIIQIVVQGAPITSSMILPAIPFVVYFLTGMVPMTTCSPSLEGKNYWIIKSSPITEKQIYLGKILASLCFSVPAQLLATLFLCISAKASVLDTIEFMILGVALCIFSATFGCACGIHFMKLDWENEIEVIKQGTAVVIYMFPNMILTSLFLFGSIFLSGAIGSGAAVIIFTVLYLLLTGVFYLRIKRLVHIG